MATLTIADLDNGKRDLQTVDAVANSPQDFTTTRYGDSVLTRAGALRRLGYQAPVPYAPGLNVDSGLFTIERDGIVYAPKPSLVPFTTGAWDGDQWLVVQADPHLRADLASANGVSLVGGAASAVSVGALEALSSGSLAKAPRAAEAMKSLAAGGNPLIDCFGDSTMWGATVGNLGVQSASNPPKVLAETLFLLYGRSFTVVNRAISGTTLAQMLAGTDGSGSTFAAKVAATASTIIYCNHCINDSQLDGSIEAYRENLATFIDLCRSYSKTPILVTPNINPPISIISEEKSKRLPAYVQMMRAVSTAKACDLVDNYHYFTQATQSVSPTELVPDGAHPSDEGYAMAGRNLAIPLVAAQHLSANGDKAGFTNSTYFDNITSSRQLRVETNGAYRFGISLSGDKAPGGQGINLAVVLENPTTDNVLSFYGLQWGSGGTSVITHNGQTSSNQLRGQINQGYSTSALDWDACILPPACAMWPGLHVVGLATNTSIPGGLGAGFAMSGVGLTKRLSVLPGMEDGRVLRNYTPMAPGTDTYFDMFFYSGSSWNARRTRDDTPFLGIDAGTTDVTVTCRGETKTLVGAYSPGTYKMRVRILQDGAIDVLAGSASVVFAATAETVPNLYPGSLGTVHSVLCFQSA